MEKVVFDERVAGIIADSAKNIILRDGYVGDSVYKIGINKGDKTGSKVESILYATLNNELLCINNVRNDLDEGSAGRMITELVKKISGSCEMLAGLELSALSNPSEDAKNVEQPIAIRILSNQPISDEKMAKVICNDVIDWLDELTVMKTAKVSEKEKESYQQEYEKIMSASLIPHQNNEVKDYSSTMAIVTATIAIIGIFARQMCVVPIIALVSGIFSGYRCYTNKNMIPCIICCVSVVIAIICTYVGWNEFFTTFNK